MISVREQIVDALVAALNVEDDEIHPPDLPDAIRAPFDQVVLTESVPMSVGVDWLEDGEAPVGDDDGDLQQHELTVGVEVRAIGTETETAEVAADRAATWVVRALRGNRLGGLALYARVARTRKYNEREQSERPACRLLIEVLVRYASDASEFESN